MCSGWMALLMRQRAGAPRRSRQASLALAVVCTGAALAVAARRSRRGGCFRRRAGAAGSVRFTGATGFFWFRSGGFRRGLRFLRFTTACLRSGRAV